MQTRNTIFTMTMPFVIIPSQASESSGEAICKPCEVTIPASRQASTSSEFSETVISGSRNTPSHTRGDQHTQLVLWSSATERSCARHSISRIPSRRPPGGANGFSRSRDAALAESTFSSIQNLRETSPRRFLQKSEEWPCSNKKGGCICDLILFPGQSSPTMSFPVTPRSVGSSPNCKDNTQWFSSSAAEVFAQGPSGSSSMMVSLWPTQ